MIDTDKKPHVSATQLEMWWKCQEQWRRRYIEGEIIPPGMALLTGTGYHGGAEVNGRQKIESHEDLPAAEIVEAAVDRFDTGVMGGYELTAEEKFKGAKTVIGAAKDTVAGLAKVYADQQAPDYQPVAVEAKVLLNLPNATHDILGYIDLIDDLDRIVDFKTAKRSPPQSDAVRSTQLTLYAAAFVREFGREPRAVRLDCAVKTKTPKRSVAESTRTAGDYEAMANRITATLSAINAAKRGEVAFGPASPGAWWCNAKWCGYYRTCPFVNSAE